jgi:hypothetical protein
MSISQLFPEEGPSLSLNLAGSKTLDPRITFTRTSSGTRTNSQGLVEVVPANFPRFDHRYVNGEIESLGLLIEEQRANLVTRSNDFSNSVWAGYCGGKSNITYNTTDVVAPDGLFTSTKVARGSNGCDGSLAWGFHWNSGIGGTIINTTDTYTASIWARGLVGGEVINVGFNDSQMTNHTLSTSWTRITRVGVANTTDRGFQVKSDTINQTFYIWGAQLEQGAFPTSYIPTLGSTVTRTADNASMTGSNFSNWYNQTEGTLFTQYKTIGDKSNQMVAQIRSDDGNNRVEIRAQGSSSSQFRIEVINNGATTQQEFTITPSGYTVNNFHKITLGYKENNFASTINGTLYTDNTGVVGNCNYMMIGAANYGSSGDYNGHISQLIYYPTRLSNAQLVSLTR